MTAAQEGQVIPFASGITLLTCADTGLPTTSISNAGNQMCVPRFIAKSLCQPMSLHKIER